MKEFFRPVRTDKILKRSFIVAAAGVILTLAYISLRFFSLPPFIPVFNQLPWGNDRIGPNYTIFIPTLAAALILGINITLSSYIYIKAPLMSRIFGVTTLLIILLTLIFSLVITNLVT